jgi:hypothetical protein
MRKRFIHQNVRHSIWDDILFPGMNQADILIILGTAEVFAKPNLFITTRGAVDSAFLHAHPATPVFIWVITV